MSAVRHLLCCAFVASGIQLSIAQVPKPIDELRAMGADRIAFESTQSGRPIQVVGYLNRASGLPRAPAVVILHGCAGVSSNIPAWVRELNSWGYTTFTLAYLEARSRAISCNGETSDSEIAREGHLAREWLIARTDVEPRVALLGFSLGGNAVLEAISNVLESRRPAAFAAAVAVYPGCRETLWNLDSPLRIEIGDADTWTRATRCQRAQRRGDESNPVELEIVPGATHAFDVPLPERDELGHRLRFDATATRDTMGRVRQFLKKHVPPSIER
jgi:dienelactone hydrolase